MVKKIYKVYQLLPEVKKKIKQSPSVKLDKAVKKELDDLKIHPRESYTSIVKKLILAGQEKIKRGEEL